MTIAFINPGTGPVEDATEALAVEAMRQFVIDTGAESFARCPEHHDDDGRFAFAVYKRLPSGEVRRFEVDIPGLPLDRVRYVDAPGQNIWHFPRLYVDGSSWVWKFAVSCVKHAGEDE
jgi:hypothetical protein